MPHTPANEPQQTGHANDDPNGWLYRVKLLFERSVMSCAHVADFTRGLLAAEQPSPDDRYRFRMLPTEVIVAMHNLRVGIEEALLGLAALGLAERGNQVKDLFIGKQGEEESTDLELLFQWVVTEGGPEGFLPVGNIAIPADSGVTPEQYQGTLEFLKEMTEKYHYYDLANVPKVMEGACRKRDGLVNPFAGAANQSDSCSHLENPQPASDGIDPEEVSKYQALCQELAEDANTLYGQFCAVGALYRAAIR